ncbi:hypothetical protein A0H81_00222 [Grifola frondosa]|uniref:Arf-GAP domain-containing protein n=1 Tax=Grifola frondosa TaxID=5627 RepID=A0A1C7MWH1_GRIFR|nr:hypothetical protein A0H81_00222 [Grifola frondosa]
MSRQDKAITERNAKTLRELLKRPENKVCADCKRNDPRWASWNLGVFLCIRCSGIHRSMGTHISRVKSVDLDVWTPEQMASIQKWGNRRANLYWEAHLRAGHIPPDHKMDSFIRSKYESRRWAREGPPPEDPSVLETDAPPVPATQQAQSPTSPMSHTPRPSLTIRQPQPHQLLSTGIANRAHQAVPHPSAPAKQPPAPQPQPATTTNELFSLDFHPPASTPSNASSEAPKKDIKQDILSLFSMPAQSTPSQPVQNTFGQFRGGVQPQAGWGQLDAQAVQQPPQTSMMGNAGVGLWGATSGWNAAPAVPAQPSLWANTATLAAAAPTQPNSSSNAAIPCHSTYAIELVEQCGDSTRYGTCATEYVGQCGESSRSSICTTEYVGQRGDASRSSAATEFLYHK